MGIDVQSSHEGLRITLRHRTQWLGALLAFAFFWVFALAFSFPWQRLRVDCRRAAPDRAPDCSVRNVHYFGLFVRERTARGVSAVDYRGSRSGSGSRRSSSSDLVLTGTEEAPVSVFGFSTDANHGTQRDVLRAIRGFLEGSEDRLQLEQWVLNVFGFFGYPLLLFVLWLTVQFPLSHLFPLFVRVDRPGNRVRGRSVMGQLGSWSIPLQDVRCVRLLDGDAAFAALYPRLTGALKRLGRMLAPQAQMRKLTDAAPGRATAKDFFVLEFQLADGTARIVGGPGVARQEFVQARDELNRFLMLPG